MYSRPVYNLKSFINAPRIAKYHTDLVAALREGCGHILDESFQNFFFITDREGPIKKQAAAAGKELLEGELIASWKARYQQYVNEARIPGAAKLMVSDTGGRLKGTRLDMLVSMVQQAPGVSVTKLALEGRFLSIDYFLEKFSQLDTLVLNRVTHTSNMLMMYATSRVGFKIVYSEDLSSALLEQIASLKDVGVVCEKIIIKDGQRHRAPLIEKASSSAEREELSGSVEPLPSSAMIVETSDDFDGGYQDFIAPSHQRIDAPLICPSDNEDAYVSDQQMLDQSVSPAATCPASSSSVSPPVAASWSMPLSSPPSFFKQPSALPIDESVILDKGLQDLGLFTDDSIISTGASVSSVSASLGFFGSASERQRLAMGSLLSGQDAGSQAHYFRGR